MMTSLPSSSDELDAEDVQRLLKAVTRDAAPAGDLGERRRAAVLAVAEICEADALHWAWGRGNPLTSSIAPVAIIHEGYSPEQLTTMIAHSLEPLSIDMFQVRAAQRLEGRSHGSFTRRDLIPDDEWRTSEHWQDYVRRLGFDSWAHAISYSTPSDASGAAAASQPLSDTWSCIHMLRRTGAAEFAPRQASLAELFLTGVSWMSARAEEQIPPEAFVDLTPRQRTVMLMLLDGSTRKEIAAALGISDYTVDDHTKAVYSHLGVKSLGELASRFLKMS